MGKVLIIKGADFSAYKIEQIELAVEAPVVSITLKGEVTIKSPYQVYYTTNGTTPTQSSTKYTGTFNVQKGTTVKAIAYLGDNYSEVVTEVYDGTLQKPTIEVSRNGVVTITSDYTVYYTVDGTTPTTSSTRYSAPFTVDDGTVIKAIASYDGINSDVVSVTADVQQPFTLNATWDMATSKLIDFEGFCLSGYVKVQPNTAYTITGSSGYDGSLMEKYATFEFTENKLTVADFWNHQGQSRTFTTKASTQYIRTCFRMSNHQSIVDSDGNVIVEWIPE